MKMSKRILPSVLASLFLGAAATGAQAQQFSQVVVFGDSLSDAGYFRPFLGTLGLPSPWCPHWVVSPPTRPGVVRADDHTLRAGAQSQQCRRLHLRAGGARVALDSAPDPPGPPNAREHADHRVLRAAAPPIRALFTVCRRQRFLQNFTSRRDRSLLPSCRPTSRRGDRRNRPGGRLTRPGAQRCCSSIRSVGHAPVRGGGRHHPRPATALRSARTRLRHDRRAGAAPDRRRHLLARERAKANLSAYGSNSTDRMRPIPADHDFGQPAALLLGQPVASNADKTYLADSIHPTSATRDLRPVRRALIDGPYVYSVLAEVPLSTRNGHVRAERRSRARRPGRRRHHIFAAGDRGDFEIDSPRRSRA